MAHLRDPFEVLGIAPTADEQAIRRAWRRAARASHPDAGGSHDRMSEINLALTEALDRAAHAKGLPGNHPTAKARPFRGVQRDLSSFTIGVLPVEAFVALELAAVEMGSIIVDEPPYMIEFTLHQSPMAEGGHAWCRCELVPEAGATTVHVTVGGDGTGVAPDVDNVRDALVDGLNSLDWTR